LTPAGTIRISRSSVGPVPFVPPERWKAAPPWYVVRPRGTPQRGPSSRRFVPTAAARLLAKCQTHFFGKTLSVPEGACCRPQTCRGPKSPFLWDTAGVPWPVPWPAMLRTWGGLAVERR
jgi:hypothetical protein